MPFRVFFFYRPPCDPRTTKLFLLFCFALVVILLAVFFSLGARCLRSRLLYVLPPELVVAAFCVFYRRRRLRRPLSPPPPPPPSLWCFAFLAPVVNRWNGVILSRCRRREAVGDAVYPFALPHQGGRGDRAASEARLVRGIDGQMEGGFGLSFLGSGYCSHWYGGFREEGHSLG